MKTVASLSIHSVAAVLLCVTVFMGCNSGNTPSPAEIASHSKPAQTQPTKTTLTGTILRKEWTKTMESWNAGGSHYFVLDVGDAPVQHRTADEGVLLLATKGIPNNTIEQYVGSIVLVTGDYFAGTPIEVSDEDEFSQRPTDLSENELRGGGFQVASIALAEDVADSGNSN